MARKYRSGAPSGHTVLVVDDSPDILESTRRLLVAEGHRVLVAPEGRTALELLATEPVELILLDYFMPGMTGEEVVRRVRETNLRVQIVLVTGYAGEKPARQMMRQLDIQGYHDKSEGAERLLLWVDSALNTYRHAQIIERQRRGLRFILDATPEMYRAASLDVLLETLLTQAQALLGTPSAFLATLPPEYLGAGAADAEGLIAADASGARAAPLEIRFATGRFRAGTPLDQLAEAERSLISLALGRATVQVRDEHSVVPLRLGNRPIGAIFLDPSAEDGADGEVLEVFANQAVAAIQHALLFEAATTDAMTGAYLRGFAMQRLKQSLRAAQRRGVPISLLMVDVDDFKQVNDSHGHAVGDQALVSVTALLQRAVRDTDIVGRYGGDEFMVVLPDTPLEGAYIVAERILAGVGDLRVRGEQAAVTLRLSVGLATLNTLPSERERVLRPEHLAAAADHLLATADQALYAHKHSGTAGVAVPLLWADILPTEDIALTELSDAG